MFVMKSLLLFKIFYFLTSKLLNFIFFLNYLNNILITVQIPYKLHESTLLMYFINNLLLKHSFLLFFWSYVLLYNSQFSTKFLQNSIALLLLFNYSLHYFIHFLLFAFFFSNPISKISSF